MARALIVGCGCRGRLLGKGLLDRGWAVRGTSRNAAGLEAIEAVGIEAAQADPAQPGTVLELVGDVAVVFWLFGSAQGEEAAIADIHGSRLERLLERLVDTPVRGFAYEAAGTVDPVYLARGAEAVNVAGERWRIPITVFEASPADLSTWVDAALEAVTRLTR